MSNRRFFPELIGMKLYKCADEYFYAWGAVDARKKKPQGILYFINAYGKAVDVKI